MSDFVTDCLNGDAFLTEIDNYIDAWHESDDDIPIHTFLGMNKKEYALFVEDETYLGYIIAARKNGEDIENAIQKIAMAARSDDQSKSKKLETWLRNKGLWD